MSKNNTSVYICNKTGEHISDISYLHRYDEDVYNTGFMNHLANDTTELIGIATYWTGFFRTGYDYWWIKFTRQGKSYTCKADFYCYLTNSDAESGKPVTLILQKKSMEVAPPKSSHCKVHLYEESNLLDIITEVHEKSGVVDKPQIEDASKKWCSQQK